jgi:hypothetical protein
MSELEQELAASAERFAAPTPHATARARREVLKVGAQPSPRWRHRHGGRVALAVTVAALIGASFAAGMSLSGGDANPSGTPAAGPGFLPTVGWDVVQSGLTPAPGPITALAATQPIAAKDRNLLAPPTATIDALGPNGVLIHVSFGAGGASGYPSRQLPLRLSEAKPGSMEGYPTAGKTLRLNAYVNGYTIDALIIFGSQEPHREALAAADEELGRIATPQCPANADALTTNDLGAAVAFARDWLAVHSTGTAISGATIVARPLSAAPAAVRDAIHGGDRGDVFSQRSARHWRIWRLVRRLPNSRKVDSLASG